MSRNRQIYLALCLGLLLVAVVGNAPAKDSRWFELARYHDADFERRSPAELAKFIGLPVSDIFPIKYDISDVAVGDPAVLKGTVRAEPEERLTQDQIIDLALEG